METETLDKLYLEWSQFTKARTERELRYAAAMTEVLNYLRHKPTNLGKGMPISILEAALEE